MKEPTNGELALMIGNLAITVENGFKGIHSRQDKTNGNVRGNTEWRLAKKEAVDCLIEDKRNITTGIVKTVWGIVITAFLAFIGFNSL